VDAEAVAPAGEHAVDVRRPDVAVLLAQRVAALAARVVEQADLDGVGDAAEDGEGDAGGIGVRAEARSRHRDTVPSRAAERRTIRSATRPVQPV
jgi:hypothetical protein